MNSRSKNQSIDNKILERRFIKQCCWYYQQGVKPVKQNIELNGKKRRVTLGNIIKLTIPLSGQFPQQWNQLEMMLQIPFYFQMGSGPVHRAYCNNRNKKYKILFIQGWSHLILYGGFAADQLNNQSDYVWYIIIIVVMIFTASWQWKVSA